MSKELSTELVYKELLVALKQQVRSAQAKAALSVNAFLIQLYWNMGKMIAENQVLFDGRNSYVAKLEKDLRAEFPDMKGFSRANLFFIRKFYQFYSMHPTVQQLVRLNENSTEVNSVEQPLIPVAIKLMKKNYQRLHNFLRNSTWFIFSLIIL